MIRNALKSADFPQFSDLYDTGTLRHSGTPNAHNGMLILVLLHSQFLHAVSRVGEAVPQYWNQGNVPVLRNEWEGTESNGAGASPLQYFTAKKSISLTPRPWWRQCPRRFRRRWSAAHRRSPPGLWLPPASAPRRRQRSFPWGYPGRSCS